MVAAAIWQVGWLQAENSVTAKQYANQDAANAQQEIAQSCGGLEAVATTECIARIVDATHERQRAESDLAAQWDAANWALLGDIVAVAGTVITGAGLWFVVLNLREARKTTRAALRSAVLARQSNRISKEIGEAQVRAYIEVEEAQIALQRAPFIPFAMPDVAIEVHNTGNSPAKAFRWCATVSFGYPEGPVIHYGDGVLPPRSDGTGIRQTTERCRRLPPFHIHQYLTAAEMEAAESGHLRAFVTIKTVFFDVFEKEIPQAFYFSGDVSGLDTFISLSPCPADDSAAEKYVALLAEIEREENEMIDAMKDAHRQADAAITEDPDVLGAQATIGDDNKSGN